MEILTQDKMNFDIEYILKQVEGNQFNERKIRNVDLENLPIITRQDLRNMKMEKHFYTSKTSGSTGEPLEISKTYQDLIWFAACNILDFKWRNWDVTKTVAIIKPGIEEGVLGDWGIPHNIEPKQGIVYTNGQKSISELQAWLEKKNPHYINCYPTVFKLLDTSRINNFIGWKGSGELGGTIYSSEECGVIALECPDNKEVYHVMDNQIVEVDIDGGMIITTLTNPYIKRYKHGDSIELGECNCGRKSQVITKIYGRVRNMFTLPNGDKKWPLIGSLDYYEKFGIKRFQSIQHTINDLELKIISEPLREKENELKTLIIKMLETPINITITYVNEFSNNKFEEFISKII
jgi:phenylacetate-CoA ligase